MKETDFESILAKYPDLIEDGLILLGRQVTAYGRRMDLLFQDRFKRKLIVELKAGTIKDEHIGQILSYEGTILSADNPDIRVMLIGTRVPANITKSLDHHGIAWKEIKFPHLRDFLVDRGDDQFLHLFDDEGDLSVRTNKNRPTLNKIENGVNSSNSRPPKPINKDAGLEQKRLKFFKGLLELSKQKTTLFSKISPRGDQSWIDATAGKDELKWGYEILVKPVKKSRVELYFKSTKTDISEKRFDILRSHKEEVEKSFGEKLEWVVGTGKARHIQTHRPGSLYDEEKWPEIQNDMVDRLIRLEKALGPYIKTLE